MVLDRTRESEKGFDPRVVLEPRIYKSSLKAASFITRHNKR